MDIIITTYSVIDYKESIRFFGSLDNMLTAIHSTTGSEHDLNEVFVGKDDSWYRRMTEIVMTQTGLSDIHDMLAFSSEKRYDLYRLLRRETLATSDQIAKFLRIQLRKESREPSGEVSDK